MSGTSAPARLKWDEFWKGGKEERDNPFGEVEVNLPLLFRLFSSSPPPPIQLRVSIFVVKYFSGSTFRSLPGRGSARGAAGHPADLPAWVSFGLRRARSPE